MEQMADLLQAERLMIERLEAVLAEMTRQGSINNNTPLTKQRLEEIASLFANNPCRVDEFPDELTIHIVVSIRDGYPASYKEIQEGVDVLIPAHLKYLIIFELPGNLPSHHAPHAGAYIELWGRDAQQADMAAALGLYGGTMLEVWCS